MSPDFDVSLRVSILEYFKFSLCFMKINLCVHIYNFKTCYRISLKARKRFWFYSGNGSLFHVSLAQFCIFLLQSCIEVTSLWTRVWHTTMHRCLIHKRAHYDNYIDIVVHIFC